MSRGVYVPLPEPAREALTDLALREWRRPSEQAAVLVIEALRRRGVLEEEGRPVPDPRPAA